MLRPVGIQLRRDTAATSVAAAAVVAVEELEIKKGKRRNLKLKQNTSNYFSSTVCAEKEFEGFDWLQLFAFDLIKKWPSDNLLILVGRSGQAMGAPSVAGIRALLSSTVNCHNQLCNYYSRPEGKAEGQNHTKIK